MSALDRDSLRDIYRRERDKRLRKDGNRQYVEIAGGFAHLLDDPYTTRFEREPLHDETEIIIVGGGFGGLVTGARLREAGFGDIRIVEKGGDFGGTWYWNRYPGAACDVESYIYLPLLEEMKIMPRHKYARATEIYAYSRLLADRYGLRDKACLQTVVTGAAWDEVETCWTVSTDRGDRLRARFLILANGTAHKPKLPGIPGLEKFSGAAFHTTRWDYSVTGGGPEGGLTKLADKRVGVIGTGATAVQCIPHLAESAGHLYVFQRTPSSIDVRNDHETDPAWWTGLAPGWQAARRENFEAILSGFEDSVDIIGDSWTSAMPIAQAIAAEQGVSSSEAAELADFAKMDAIRKRVDEVVRDPETARALKPFYQRFCKRPCFHDEYLAAFNRQNVTLVDTDGRGVDEVTDRGVTAAGKAYELDCLVFATGFEIGTSYTRRAGYDVVGADGRSLAKKWREGVMTLHGVQTAGFPNLFFLMGEQAAFTINFTHLIDEQAQHITHILQAARDTDRRRIEATPDAERAWSDEIVARSQERIDFLKSCTPGYYNGEGQIDSHRARLSQGLPGPVYFDCLRKWRFTGQFHGLDLR